MMALSSIFVEAGDFSAHFLPVEPDNTILYGITQTQTMYCIVPILTVLCMLKRGLSYGSAGAVACADPW